MFRYCTPGCREIGGKIVCGTLCYNGWLILIVLIIVGIIIILFGMEIFSRIYLKGKEYFKKKKGEINY